MAEIEAIKYPAEAFYRLVDLASQEERLQAELLEARQARQMLAPRLLMGIGRTPLVEVTDPRDRLRAGIVLGDQPQSADGINKKLEQLETLNSRIAAGSSNVALWIGSRYEQDDAMISSHGPIKYKPVARMGIGRLTDDASIQVTNEGEFRAPLVSGLIMPVRGYGQYDATGVFGAIDPATPLKLYQVNTQESKPVRSMRIETVSGDIGKFVLLVGEAEIQAALEDASGTTRTSIEASLEEFTAKLF